MSDDGQSQGSWSGIISTLVFASLVAAVATIAITACHAREIFYSRKYFVHKETVVTVTGAARAAAPPAPIANGGATAAPLPPAAAAPTPDALQQPTSAQASSEGGKAGKKQKKKKKADDDDEAGVKRVLQTLPNTRYYPPEPPAKFGRASPVLFPWPIAVDALRRLFMRSRLHAAVSSGQFALAGNVSLDAHMHQFYLMMAFLFFLVFLVLCIPVAIVNATSGGPYSDPLYALATSRVPQQSGRMWVHYGVFVVLTVVLLALLHWGYREYEYLRLYWLAVLSPARYSVLITGLPRKAPPSAQRPQEGTELRLMEAAEEGRAQGGAPGLEAGAEAGVGPGTPAGAGAGLRGLSLSSKRRVEEYRHVKKPSATAAATGGATTTTTPSAGSAGGVPPGTPTMTATTAGIGAASLQTPSKTVGMLTASKKAPNPLTVLCSVKASSTDGANRGYRRYLRAAGTAATGAGRTAPGVPVTVSTSPLPPSVATPAMLHPASDSTGNVAAQQPTRPFANPLFDTAHIRLLIAHQRASQKLEKHGDDYTLAVAEWEEADQKRKTAIARRQSIYDEPYGRVKVLKHYRRGLLERWHLKKAKPLTPEKEIKRAEAEEEVMIAVALHRISREMTRRFGQMMIVRNRYDSTRVQMARINSVAGATTDAGIEPSAAEQKPATTAGLGAVVAEGAAISATAISAVTASAATPTSTATAVPNPIGSAKAADLTAAPLAESKLLPLPPPRGAVGVSSGVTTSAVSFSDGKTASQALLLDAPDIEALSRERYSVERAVSEGLLPSPKHKSAKKSQSFLSAEEKIKSRTRMPASDTAIVTYLTAADASQVVAQGKVAFAEGRVNPASSALLMAYGLPPGGIKRATLNYHHMRVQQAPEPSDVIWKNTSLKAHERMWKPVIAYIWLAVVIFIAGFPTVAAAFLSNLSAMGLVAGFLEPVTRWAGLSQGLIQNLLPALIVRVVEMLLLTFVTIIAKLRGELSFSGIDVWAAKWIFVAAFISTIVIYSIASTIFGASTAVFQASAATQTLTLLAQSLPEQSGTFIAFVIIATLQGWLMTVWRPVDIIKWAICKRRDQTDRMLKHHQRSFGDRPPYVSSLPDSALMMSIGLLYGLMNPPLVVVVACYFLFAIGMSSHQLLYVYETPWQTGGQFYPMAAGMTVGGLIFAQAVWVFLFIMKEVQVAGYLMAIPIVITVATNIWWGRRFEKPLKFLPPVAALAIQQKAARGAAAVVGGVSSEAVEGFPFASNAEVEEILIREGYPKRHAAIVREILDRLDRDSSPSLQPSLTPPTGAGTGSLSGSTSVGTRADLSQWYFPDPCRPSPYVNPAFSHACDTAAGKFDWTGDGGSSVPAPRLRVWAPLTAAPAGTADARPAADVETQAWVFSDVMAKSLRAARA